MKIEFSDILDVHKENLDQSKISFTNNLIKTMQPLIDEFYVEKIKKITAIKNEMKEIKTRMVSEKEEMRGMLSQHKRVAKVSKLLGRIEKIVESGLTYGSTKRELLIVLKVLDKLSDERVDIQLNEMMNILSRGLNTNNS